MRVLAIDAGYEQSALLLYDADKKQIIYKIICSNWECERIILFSEEINTEFLPHCVIEMPECMGMAVGKDVLDTCRTVGRFELLADQQRMKTHLISRGTVKLYLCGNKRARDSNIRQALIDKFGPSKKKAVGTKKRQGPLYGVSKDLWSALAIAVTYAEMIEIKTV